MTEVSLHRRRMADLVATTAERIVAQATADGVPVADLPDMKLRWYRIGEARQRSVREPGEDGQVGRTRVVTETTVYVYDRIGGSMGVTAKKFAADLAEIDTELIQLRINSPGGSVTDALAIMNTIRDHPAYVIGHIDGITASAATIIMMGCDRVEVEPGGMLMVHKASMQVDGDDDDLEKLALWLRRQSENVADLYAQKSGGTREQWMALMTAETWMYGEEAVSLRLADKANVLTPIPDPEMRERMRRQHSLAGFRHAGREAQGDVKPVPWSVAHPTPKGSRARNRRASSEVREAAGLRLRALDKRLMTRSAPAGMSTVARRSPSGTSGELRHSLVEFRGREMIETSGHFTIYNRGYEMWDMYGPYTEVVVGGSGKDSLARRPDCIFLVNHTGLAMARTGGPWNQNRGTLELAEEEVGGWHRAYLNPERDDVKLFVTGMDDGQITEMSYAFMIEEGEWNDDMTEYAIHRWEINRGDVSGVNYGANPYTDIAARAPELLAELEQLPGGAIREAVRRLSQRVESYERLLREVGPGSMAQVADVALAEPARPASGEEKAAAEKWVAQAIGTVPEDPPEETPEQPADSRADAKVIDNDPGEGRTVAQYEALLRSMGVKVPQ